MRILLLGPPGSGKGTQAERLARRLQVPKLVTGEMLRNAVGRDTPIGREAKGYMDRGELVPDRVTINLIQERLHGNDCRAGYILDGFPRNRAQAEALDRMVAALGESLEHVVLLDVPETEILRRLAGRRICRQCAATYHVIFQPPSADGRCAQCGGALHQREDDREETIRQRLTVYATATAPVIEYYARQGLLRRVTGVGTTEEVFAAVCSLIV